ncbi:MAG: DUF169 domain-containing protein [Clostridiales bacterium]|nr:DUF169 domain-containing protein [Clostridiales bacterium]
MEAEKYNILGKELEEILILRYSPIALKILYEGDIIPEDTIRPFKDRGDRLSMCQATALVRRNRNALTMLKEDHWCVWPLVSYKMVELDEDDCEYMGTKFFMSDPERSKRYLREEYPMLKTDKAVVGLSMAPLRSANFEPDLVLIYCRPAQLRSIMMAAKYFSGEMIKVALDPVDSCVHSTIPVLNGQDYNVTIPDPGEYERGMTDEDEVMFTMKAQKTDDIVKALKILSSANFGYREMAMDMPMNFARPEFYNVMFKKWGLESGEVWKK